MSRGRDADRATPCMIVGVGASAGGLDACKQLFAGIPVDSGIAFVVVLHLDPSRESNLAAIFQAHSALQVVQVTDVERIEPDHVYVIAPNTSLALVDDALHPGSFAKPHGEHMPVDMLFSSLAAAQHEAAVAVVLSGIGNDGVQGIRDIKEAGGLCIAQDPETARHPGMPQGAIHTGMVDEVLPPHEIARFLLEYAKQPRARPLRPAVQPATQRSAPPEPQAFEGVMALLARAHGLDWHAYKEGTMRRRAERRMAHMALPGWPAYLAYLHEHPDEITALYHDVLVGVTQFFRDPEAWEQLAREVLPELLRAREHEDTPIRIWSAGCATGEEAYSLAMVFLEQLDKLARPPKLQVFATDVSHEALALARQGVYPASEIAPDRLAQFFHRQGDAYQIKQHVRDTVTFAPHDLLSDPPFSRLDLVSCRNLFIYLLPRAQQQCLERFHFALRPRGVLWLGSSENVGRHNDLFTPLLAKHRLYRKSEVSRHRALSWSPPIPRPLAQQPPRAARSNLPSRPGEVANLTRLVEQFILERYGAACAVINQAGNVLHLFGPTEGYLLQPKGEIRTDLLSWVRPGLYLKLRTALEKAFESGEKVTIPELLIQRSGAGVRVTCDIEPMTSLAEGLFVVVFRDLPEPRDASLAAASGPPPVPSATEASLVHQLTQQLQESQAELQSTLEELDSANEEYRASYEELVSLNEELQSSNEELETTKEEAQSINEELMIANRELEDRNTSLRLLNADLENLLALTTIPIVFLDRQLRIRRFTPAASRVMWLVPSDLGRSIEHIKTRVQDPRLTRDAMAVLEALVPIEAEVQSEDGLWYARKVVPFRTDDRIDGVCIIFYDITSQKLAAEESEEARHLAEAIVRTSRLPFVVLDSELTVVSANDAFHEAFAVSRTETEGKRLYDLGKGQWDIPALRGLLERVMTDKAAVVGHEVEHVFDAIGPRHLLLNASMMERPGRVPLVLLSVEDVTELRHAQRAVRERTEELELANRRKDEFLAMLGHELRNPLAALVNGLTLVQMTERDPDEIERVHAMLARQTRRMTVMLDQLLDVSRLISDKIVLEREPVDLAAVAMAAIETAMPLIDGEDHRLEVSLPPPRRVLVLGDLVRLTQVMENLLSNAAKYTDPGGRIWLTVDATDDLARITVRDTGIGIEPDLLPDIFNVFFQAEQDLKRSRGGLGLGLPFVRRLVNMHGGEVTAFSQGRGKGSELVVTLPRLRERPRGDAGGNTGDDPGGPVQANMPRRILLIDDEEDAASALAGILQEQGHELRAAHDGRTALRLALDFRPELVLLDLGLPDIDGYEVARQLRAQRPHERLLLVALTGYPKDDQALQDAGFDLHLIKPVDVHRLAALLNAWGRGVPAGRQRS